MDVIEYVGSLGGVGAVFGLLFFYAFRKAIDQMREDRTFSEDRLTKMIEADQKSREGNTTALTELIIYLKAKNGNK